ncbi:MAG TPA: 4-hydroxythreonine-4-phosphate dehydrogenase PdxA [Candidatus Atribacteria bacterium]|nr:4-hydroxythreonine-4-phosphate dehydrogenase PdxA [Candidatus Atribacteria bacterium]
MNPRLPIIAITLGDPSGIGPEIIIQTLQKWSFPAIPLVIGDREVLNQTEEVTKTSINWQKFSESISNPGPYLLDCSNVDLSSFRWGEISSQSGQCSFEYIQTAIQLALKGKVDAVVTAPISKEALHLAAVPFIGHTEIFKELTKSSVALTMFQLDQLRVFFLTRHLSLLEAVKEVKKEKIYKFLLEMDQYLNSMGLFSARIAVAALNPHGGENGLLGQEEIKEINPAIEESRKLGIDVKGIYPADSVFWFARQGRFDAVLSLYHDQGHIATKCMDFYGTVSVTLGLPFIRTSPDHGTAFDIAGQGKANHRSMVESCRWAVEYAFAYRDFIKRTSGEKEIGSD